MRKEESQLLRIIFISILSFSILLISACNGEKTKDAEYDTTKKMVVDILQTDDGKKALSEIMEDEKMKKQLIIESDTVKKSLNDALASKKGKEMWTNLFKDPAFVETFSKSMAEEQRKLIKQLMNHFDYQKQKRAHLQNPDISDQMLKMINSQQFRCHSEETIRLTVSTPSFQAKIKETVLDADEEQGKKEKQ